MGYKKVLAVLFIGLFILTGCGGNGCEPGKYRPDRRTHRPISDRHQIGCIDTVLRLSPRSC
jgi:hypothetical protein